MDEYTNPPRLDDESIIIDSIENNAERPQSGLSTYIGKSSAQFVEQFGKPNRVDASLYGYEWWIYNSKETSYMQVGVQEETIVTIYAVGENLELQPFKIGQTIGEIYRTILLQPEILVQIDEGTYRFELTEEDLNIRPLIQLGDIYAQLSIDKLTGKLFSIRFIDKETLVKMRPYELVYRGKLMSQEPLSESEWRQVEEGTEKQIFDITNILRERFEVTRLSWDEETAKVAFQHSEDMEKNQFFSHSSPHSGELTDRLDAQDINYKMAGENLAVQYIDGPAAVEGWLNSEAHRNILLEIEFTHLGVGVYQKTYTQNFIKKDEKLNQD